MDIHFGIIGQLIIKDVRNIINIQTACGYICGNQHFNLAAAESAKDLLTRILFEVAIQGFGGESTRRELTCELSRFDAGADEYQRAGNGFDLKEVGQRRQFISLMHEVVALLSP